MSESLPARLVREFHEHFGLPIRNRSRTTDRLRARLISEEAREASDAIEAIGMSSPGGPTDEEMGRVAQELADVVYVAYGAALTYGIDLDVALHLVHQSNMTKEAADASGKVRKGPAYRAPEMSAAVREGCDCGMGRIHQRGGPGCFYYFSMGG